MKKENKRERRKRVIRKWRERNASSIKIIIEQYKT